MSDILLLGAYSVLLVYYIIISKPSRFHWSFCYYAFIFLAVAYIILPLLMHGACVWGLKWPTSFYKPDAFTSFATYIITFCGLTFFNYAAFKPHKPLQTISYTIDMYRLRIVLYITSILSILSFYIVVSQQGGITAAYANTVYIRSGYYIDVYGHDSFLFFYRFIPLSMCTFFGFLTLQKKKTIDYMFLISSFVVSVFYCIYLGGGRQNIIDIIVSLMVIQLIKKKRAISLLLPVALILLFSVFPYMKYWVNGGIEFGRGYEGEITSSPIHNFIAEFSFMHCSLYQSIDYQKYNFFLDFVKDIFGSFLPSGWKPSFLGPLSNYVNTQLLTGIHRGFVPPGIMGQGYYALGIVGVIVTMVITGRVFSFFDMMSKRIRQTTPVFLYIYIYAVFCSMSWIRTGLPHNYWYAPKTLFFLIVIFLCTKRNKLFRLD